MRERYVYALVGGVVGSLLGYGLRCWFAVPAFVESCLTLGGGLGVVALAERTGQVKKPEELARPVSLFDSPRQE